MYTMCLIGSRLGHSSVTHSSHLVLGWSGVDYKLTSAPSRSSIGNGGSGAVLFWW